MINFSNRLLNWFDKHGRKDLPWQQNKTFYRVWLSEIMLQQTQVKTVIPYYENFLTKFPTLKDLANANVDEVLTNWAGLGYYARARNLHKAAQMILNDLNGQFPNTLEAVESLPGIGHSTACAILSIVENQPLAICDGNVKRVLGRLHAINTPIGAKETENAFIKIAREYMSTERPADYTQAIMDLGATLCTRTKPNCAHCPVQSLCKAYKLGTPTAFPVPKKKLKRSKQSIDCVILKTATHIALTQRPPKGIWGGLHTPLITDDINTHEIGSLISKAPKTILETRKHVFTHIDLFYTPHIYNVSEPILVADFHWHKLDQIDTIALPAPIKKLIDDITEGKINEQLDLLSEA